MSVGEFDSPWPEAVWVAAAAAGSVADAAGAVEGVTGHAARGQCLEHSFGEAKLLRQRSRPRV